MNVSDELKKYYFDYECLYLSDTNVSSELIFFFSTTNALFSQIQMSSMIFFFLKDNYFDCECFILSDTNVSNDLKKR